MVTVCSGDLNVERSRNSDVEPDDCCGHHNSNASERSSLAQPETNISTILLTQCQAAADHLIKSTILTHESSCWLLYVYTHLCHLLNYLPRKLMLILFSQREKAGVIAML